MKVSKILTVVALVFCVISAANAKKLYIMNFEKGDMPSDGTMGTLTEENTDKTNKMMLKVATEGGKSIYFGEWGAKKGNWSDYELLKFKIFNPQKDIVRITMNIGDAESQKAWDYNNRAQLTFVCRPGASEQEVQIQGTATNSGRAIELKAIKIWNMTLQPTGNKDTTLYFGNIYLETEEEEGSKAKK